MSLVDGDSGVGTRGAKHTRGALHRSPTNAPVNHRVFAKAAGHVWVMIERTPTQRSQAAKFHWRD